MRKERELIESWLLVGQAVLVSSYCPSATKSLCTNSCSRNDVKFFVFAERQLPKQVSRAPECSQLSGALQWLQYKDHCYAFDMAFYNFSVYNAEDAKKVCQKLSKFRFFVVLPLKISLLLEKK